MRKSYGLLRRKAKSKDPDKPKEYASAGPGGGSVDPRGTAETPNYIPGLPNDPEKTTGKVCSGCGYPESMGHDPQCDWIWRDDPEGQKKAFF